MPGGPSSYNNWVKDHPLTTNSIYGYLVQKQVEEKKAREAYEKQENSYQQHESQKHEIKLPKNYVGTSMKIQPDFTHARRSNYFIAEPLPESIVNGRFKRKFQIIPKSLHEPNEMNKDIYLWNAVSGCTVRPTM